MKTVLYNCKAYTVDGDQWEKNPQSVLVINDNGMIEYVGREDSLNVDLMEDANAIDLQGKIVLPGLVDSHVHAPGDAYSELFEFSIEGLDHNEIKDVVREFAEKNPGLDIYFGSGCNIGMTDDNGMPICARWIDEGCSDKPVIIRSIDMHSRLLNTKAMELMGIDRDTVTSSGYIHRFDDGQPTGVFTDARDIINIDAEHSNEEKLYAMRHFISKMNAWGYTSIMSIAPNMDLSPEIYLKMEDEDLLTLRVNCSDILRPESPEESFHEIITHNECINNKNKITRFSTAKITVDGVVEGKTAYLSEPYSDKVNEDEYRGKPCWDESELIKYVVELDRLGLQIHFHSVGDAATKLALDAIERAGKVNKTENNRHVITHLQLVNNEDFERFKENGVIAAIQPFWHCKEPDWFEAIDQNVLGVNRAEREYPLKSFLKAGIKITSSGDFPVSSENNPFIGIQTGVTRNLNKNNCYDITVNGADDPRFILGEEERVSIKDMIESYTINGAYQLFRENEIGSITVGKYADLIVVDKDPFDIDVMEIENIEVKATIFNGKVVYGEL